MKSGNQLGWRSATVTASPLPLHRHGLRSHPWVGIRCAPKVFQVGGGGIWGGGGGVLLFCKHVSTASYVQTRLGVFVPPRDLSQKLLCANTLTSHREREKLWGGGWGRGMSEGL